MTIPPGSLVDVRVRVLSKVWQSQGRVVSLHDDHYVVKLQSLAVVTVPRSNVTLLPENPNGRASEAPRS